VRGIIQAQLKLVGGQLATYYQKRPSATDPPRIDILRLFRRRLMDDRIVKSDDMRIDLNGVRYENRVRMQMMETFCDGGFAVATRPVQEQGRLRSERRPQV
jgi:hypothetical protein